MEKIYENIINEGKKNGKTVETINAELKEAGANFHLIPTAAWPTGPRRKWPRASFLRRRSRRT